MTCPLPLGFSPLQEVCGWKKGVSYAGHIKFYFLKKKNIGVPWEAPWPAAHWLPVLFSSSSQCPPYPLHHQIFHVASERILIRSVDWISSIKGQNPRWFTWPFHPIYFRSINTVSQFLCLFLSQTGRERPWFRSFSTIREHTKYSWHTLILR